MRLRRLREMSVPRPAQHSTELHSGAIILTNTEIPCDNVPDTWRFSLDANDPHTKPYHKPWVKKSRK